MKSKKVYVNYYQQPSYFYDGTSVYVNVYSLTNRNISKEVRNNLKRKLKNRSYIYIQRAHQIGDLL